MKLNFSVQSLKALCVCVAHGTSRSKLAEQNVFLLAQFMLTLNLFFWKWLVKWKAKWFECVWSFFIEKINIHPVRGRRSLGYSFGCLPNFKPLSFIVIVPMVDLFSAEQPVWRLYLDGCTEQRACAFQMNSGRDWAVDRHMPSQRGPGGRQHLSGRAARLHASPAPSAVPERPVLCLGRGLQMTLHPKCRCAATGARNRQHSVLPQRHARNGPLVLLPGKKESHLAALHIRHVH